MGKIAIEEHWVLNQEDHIDRWRTLVPMIPEQFQQRLITQLTDTSHRLEVMDQGEIDLAVLSNGAVVQGSVEPQAAMRIARESNDHLAEIVRARPDRFAAFAATPLQHPEQGADELQRAVEQLGLVGTMLFGQTDGRYLDDRSFDPFWERAQDLDVPVYLHAADAAVVPPSQAGRPELRGPTWSWTAETATHALRIVFGGVFDRFPRVRLILGHMGETLPYFLWRLDQRAAAFADHAAAMKPSELVRRNIRITTAGVFSDEPLHCALDALGEDSVMYSIDYPFESMTEGAQWLDASTLDEKVRAKIERENARALLKLNQPVR
ncbi:MAG TPA: amidohydrolase family protein [Trebonia sp.]|nr:amidohydrolase family protein [Trebonia sp.]